MNYTRFSPSFLNQRQIEPVIMVTSQVFHCADWGGLNSRIDVQYRP